MLKYIFMFNKNILLPAMVVMKGLAIGYYKWHHYANQG